MLYIHTVSDGRHEVKLGKRIAGGGAGTVYRVDDPRYPCTAAKVYHKPADLEVQRIEHMIANPPQNSWMKIKGQHVPTLTWPTHLLHDGSGQAIGYLMPFVDCSQAVTMQVYVEEINALPAQDQSISLRMNVARNLAALLAELHSKRNYVIDLKPQNIMIFKETGNIALLDCDGFAIGGGKFPAPQYSQQYQAPEVLINRSSPQSLSLNDYHDRFAMSVIMFQILNYGTHPFMGIPVDMSNEDGTTDGYLKLGWYAYGPSPSPHLAPNPSSIHGYWEEETLLLFNRAFTVNRPSDRPSAKEWLGHFDRLFQRKPFIRCNSFPNDVRHIHFKGKGCFLCEKFMQVNDVSADSPIPLKQPKTGCLKSSIIWWVVIVGLIAFLWFLSID